MNTASAKRPKIALFAYSEVGYVCLEELLRANTNVVVVFTHEDDPNEEIWFRSVKALASEHGIPARADTKLGANAVDYLRELGVELIFSFYYRAMIPNDVLLIPRLGSYNMHGALLPKYRGRACVNWAVLNGETETGATLHVMTELADRGDIIDQEKVAIDFEDTAHDVFLKVAEASRVIMARSLSDIETGRASRTPQDEAQATKFGRRRPEDGLIDWDKTSIQIYNQVRALTHPFPGAFAYIDGRKCFIWRAKMHDEGGENISAAAVSRDPFLIAACDGVIEVLSWQFEGEAERGCLGWDRNREKV